MISTNYHNPVLLAESIGGLNIIEDGIYVDATYGGGGHSREILSRLGKKGQLIVFDQDFDSKANLIDDNRLLFINENFMYLKKFLKLNNISKLDGILADFGVSSYQIDKPERGFSYRFEADLDMRMDNNSSLTARQIINKYTSEDLNKIIIMTGEQYSREEDFHGDSIPSNNFVEAAVEIYQTDVLGSDGEDDEDFDEWAPENLDGDFPKDSMFAGWTQAQYDTYQEDPYTYLKDKTNPRLK